MSEIRDIKNSGHRSPQEQIYNNLKQTKHNYGGKKIIELTGKGNKASKNENLQLAVEKIEKIKIIYIRNTKTSSESLENHTVLLSLGKNKLANKQKSEAKKELLSLRALLEEAIRVIENTEAVVEVSQSTDNEEEVETEDRRKEKERYIKRMQELLRHQNTTKETTGTDDKEYAYKNK